MTGDEPTYYTVAVAGVEHRHRHPAGFRPDTSKPHECVPFRLGGNIGYQHFCASDGELWPCPTMADRYLQEHYDKHGKRL